MAEFLSVNKESKYKFNLKVEYMLVKNIFGSSRFPRPNGYASWLAYWEAQTGYKATYCSASNCVKRDLVGAHVQKVFGNDNKWYIVPLCLSCNQRTDTFSVPDNVLVPVPSNL